MEDEVFKEFMDAISDMNCAATKLAEARLELAKFISTASFNDGNDINANWAKLKEVQKMDASLERQIDRILKNNH
jgi:vacuolar-type H+-ATPase subunit D/Vma8